MRTCVDDNGLDAIGVFDRQAPRCIAIECRVLPVFANGIIVYATDVTANFELGTTATYSCNDGYTLDLSIGVEVRTCIDDGDNDAVGVFSDQEPACVLIQCTPLPGIPNGRIEYGPDTTANYMLGTTATYICNDGFFLDLSAGNEARTCEDNNGLDDLGEFTGSQPTCVLIECSSLMTITNGVITYAPDIIPNYDLGTEATYDCDAGFVLDLSLGGSEMRTCFDDLDNNAEGVFSGQAPACILSGPQCPLGTYVEQLSSGVPSCVTCPANSNGVETNSPECTCFNGYHRTNLEGPNIPCTSPSSVCRNIELVQQRTQGNSITVRWERPEITGRDDFYYNIFYSEDNQTFTQHNRRPYLKQDALVDYSVSGLQPLTTYTIRVISENGVSGEEEGGQSRSCEVVAMTGDTNSEAPSRVLGLCSVVVWTIPHRSYGRITSYDVNFVNPGSDNVIVAKGNRELFHIIGDEVSVSNQERVMVQVRAKTAATNGQWSTLVTLGCN